MLELLLLKGSQGLEIAKELSVAFALTPRSTARMLAQMYLKGMLETGDTIAPWESNANSSVRATGSRAQKLTRQTR